MQIPYQRCGGLACTQIDHGGGQIWPICTTGTSDTRQELTAADRR